MSETPHPRWPQVVPFASALAHRLGAESIVAIGLGDDGWRHFAAIPPPVQLYAIDAAALQGRVTPASLGDYLSLIDERTFVLLGPELDESTSRRLAVEASESRAVGLVLARIGREDEGALSTTSRWLASIGLTPLVSGYSPGPGGGGDQRDVELFFASKALTLPDDSGRTTAVAVVPVFNEADIIVRTIDRLIRQGLRVHVIDNWSDDGSFELVEELAHSTSAVTLERFPDSSSSHYEWASILDRLDEYGSASDAEWIVHVDADEFLDSFSPDFDLLDALGIVQAANFDVVDFTVIDFRPTLDSLSAGRVPDSWEFGLRLGHLNIQRAWRNRKAPVGISSTGGHVVPDPKRVFPLNFVLRHYPLRSPEQARRKIYQDRLPRVHGSDDRSERGWHRQYDGYRASDPFVWDQADLHEWTSDTLTTWMPELTTRAGLVFGEGTYVASPFDARPAEENSAAGRRRWWRRGAARKA